MKLHFRDQTFSFELLRAASYGLYGGSEIGEVLATAHRIREGDCESWNLEWSRVAERIEAIANTSLQVGQRAASILARKQLLSHCGIVSRARCSAPNGNVREKPLDVLTIS